MDYNKTSNNNGSAMASISHDYRHFKAVTVPSTSTSTTTNAELQPSNQTGQGKRIVDSLWELELDSILGDHKYTEAVHQLIVALIIIALISVVLDRFGENFYNNYGFLPLNSYALLFVLICTVLVFRCYMLYCQDFPNVRRYQVPPMSNELQPMHPASGLPTVPPALVPRHRKQTERGVTFRSIFDDDSPFIKV